MKLCVLFMLLLVGLVRAEEGEDHEEVESKCPHVILQEDVDFENIEGKWRQIYYTRGTFYKDAICYHMHVDVNPANETQQIVLTYHFTTKLPKKGAPATEYIEGVAVLTTDGSEEFEEHDHAPGTQEDQDHNSGKHEEIHLFRNHIATDYQKYLMLYTCDELTGEILFDIQLRAEKKMVGKSTRAAINAILERFGLHITKMSRVNPRQCPEDK